MIPSVSPDVPTGICECEPAIGAPARLECGKRALLAEAEGVVDRGALDQPVRAGKALARIVRLHQARDERPVQDFEIGVRLARLGTGHERRSRGDAGKLIDDRRPLLNGAGVHDLAHRRARADDAGRDRGIKPRDARGIDRDGAERALEHDDLDHAVLDGLLRNIGAREDIVRAIKIADPARRLLQIAERHPAAHIVLEQSLERGLGELSGAEDMKVRDQKCLAALHGDRLRRARERWGQGLRHGRLNRGAELLEQGPRAWRRLRK